MVEFQGIEEAPETAPELDTKTIVNNLRGTTCLGCDRQGKKRSLMSFCSSCYYELSPATRQSLYKRVGDGYCENFRIALGVLTGGPPAEVGTCSDCGKEAPKEVLDRRGGACKECSYDWEAEV